MDDVTRTALTNGHFECIDHQFGAQVVRHGPADDLAAPGIEDHGKIKKPTCRRYEGDVGDPELVRSHCRKIAIDQIRRRPRRQRSTAASRSCNARRPARTTSLAEA